MSNSMPYATIMIGDVFEQLALIPDESVDCCVTSPPYWGLRDYGYEGQIGLEPTLGEHLDVMVRVFDEVRRILKPMGTCWINYGDCYATKPNGRSAADAKLLGDDDRTFRDKPFSTIGPVYQQDHGTAREARRVGGVGYGRGTATGRVVAGGYLKEKDLCMIPNRLAIALQDAGWWVRAENIWGKPNPMPDSSGKYRPSTAHEKVWLLTRSAKSHYDSLAVKMPVSDGANARAPKWKAYCGGRGIAPTGASVQFDLGDDPTPVEPAYPVPAGWATGEGAHGTIHPDGSRRGGDGTTPKSAKAGMKNKNNDSFAKATVQMVSDRYLRNYEPDLSPLAPIGVMHIATAAYADAHFATFPPALVIPCILAGCPQDGVVLDPFGGAGTTSLVAQGLKRNSIMIEMSEEYAAMARRRIDNGNIGFGLEAAE